MSYDLGRIQIAILRLLRDDVMDKTDLYESLRKSLYNDDVPLAISRHRIRSAIRALKRRNLINERYGILSTND